MLNADEISAVNEIIRMLVFVKTLSGVIGGENYVTISSTIPQINCLFVSIKNVKTETKIGIDCQKIILKEIDSMLLDPRFKKIHFLSAKACSEAVTHFNKKLKQMKSQGNSISSTVESAEVMVPEKNNFWAYHNAISF